VRPTRRLRTALLAGLAAAALCKAQEPTFMEAATHPGAGSWYGRLRLDAAAFSEAEGRVDESTILLKLAYGVRGNLALLIDGTWQTVSRAGGADASGFAVATVRAKVRVFKRDLGPLNTWRASITAGADLPGGSDPPAPEHTAPRLGIATTAILNRHGLNGQADWTGRRAAADILALNGSYLYRLAPAVYSVHTRGAWYAMLESLNTLADDGDYRLECAAGLLYEARRWAAEVSARAPVGQDAAREADGTVSAGLRLLF
jgi:hypothetical protein